jgi:aromatic-amino-acid transaminase
MPASIFTAVEMAPRDPILGLTEQFNADTNPAKVNLGVGVYFNDEGKLPVLRCVAEAEKQLLAAPKAKNYLPIDGLATYDKAVQGLVFGNDSEAVTSGRVATVQSLGGTGGLKVGADFLRRLNPAAKALLSDPSWENHRALFTNAGFVVETYPYYDAATRDIRFDAMLAACAPQRPARWSCCMPAATTRRVTTSPGAVGAGRRGLPAGRPGALPGHGLSGLRPRHPAGRAGRAQLPGHRHELLVSTSFSKSFSLYGERAGALSVVCGSKDEAARVLSQLKIVIRSNYSTPPTFGAQVVSLVLTSPDLRAMWEEELAGMRDRIKSMRHALVAKLQAAGVKADLGYITRQMGMFSYSGLTPAQMQRLRSEFGVYGLDSGRICVAALNSRNIDAVASALAKVM